MSEEVTEENTKIVSKEEALWTKVKDARVETIDSLKDSLVIEEAFLELAEEKLKAF